MFIAYGGARGGGRLHALKRRYGYQRIILEAIRMKVKYPFWKEIDEIIERYLDWLRWEESIYWGDELHPFYSRYPWIKKPDYSKGNKHWRD